MTDLSSTICENFISFFISVTVREKERKTLREGRREHRALEQRQNDLWSPIPDLRSAMRGERRWRASCGVAATWLWVTGFGLLGFGLGLCIGDFFFLDKHLCHSVFGLLLSLICFCWFALYRQYWGLISLPPIWFLCSDVMGSIFWFSIIFFVFFC